MTVAQQVQGTFISEDADLPLALAELFCKMFGDEQAAFFDHVARISDDWKVTACFQWRMMEDDITPIARKLLKAMYDHTEKGPV